MFTQMSAHKGIKLFGGKAIAAMMKELKQLNDGVIPGNPVIQPIPFKELTSKDNREAIEAVNNIAQKRSGKIKGRMCANGSRQRKFLKDDEHQRKGFISRQSKCNKNDIGHADQKNHSTGIRKLIIYPCKKKDLDDHT